MNIHYDYQKPYTGTLPKYLIIDIGGGIQDLVAILASIRILQ